MNSYVQCKNPQVADVLVNLMADEILPCTGIGAAIFCKGFAQCDCSTDVVGERDGCTRSGPYDPVRDAKVITRTFAILDMAAPPANGTHADVQDYTRDGCHLLRHEMQAI